MKTVSNPRTKQLCVIIPADLDEKIRKIAYLKRTTANTLAFHLLQQYAENCAELVEMYDKLFGKQLKNSIRS